MLEHAALLLDHDRVQKSGAGQPGHEGRDLDRVPAPVAAPAENVISPAAAEHQAEGQEQPGPQGPAAGEAYPAIVGAACDQRGDGESVRDNEGDKSKIQHRGMDDHARMAQERVQSLPIGRGEQDAVRRLEGVRADPLKGLIKLRKRVLEKQVHAQEEGHGNARDHDHPRQEFAVAVPLAESHQRGEYRHQPGPEQQRAGLSAPPGCNLQIGGHAAAGHFVDELHFVVVVDEQIDQNACSDGEQRPGQEHGAACTLHGGWVFGALTIDGSKHTVEGRQE